MTKKVLSDNVKKLKQRRAKEEALKNAAQAYIERKDGYGDQKPTYAGISLEFGVKETSLRRHVQNKGVSISESNAKKQKLSPTEESTLVRFMLESADLGFPLTHRQMEQHANTILMSRQGPDYVPVGKQWVFNFIDRHHERLQTHWSKPLDTQRAKSLNPAALESWWKILEEYVVKMGVDVKNIYGMDESGCPTAYTGKERVVGARGTKTQHKQGGADRENVTAIVTICADGSTVKPLIIFKGKKMQTSWNDGNVADAAIICSDNGWTDGSIGFKWLRDVFDPARKDKAEGKPRVLILDGHSLHYTKEFLTYARENNIIVLGYPPHCTHALQGLDVVCFAKMKDSFKKIISEFERTRNRPVTKSDFTNLFGQAYIISFTPNLVKAAFRVTGVVPFNCDAISEKQVKPSKTSSIKGQFPLPQPSPVRAILAAMNPATRTSAHEVPSDEAASPNSSPRRVRDEDIDPALFTPTKRQKRLDNLLEATLSGSFLVSSSPYRPSTSILDPVLEAPPQSLAAPDWKLLRTPEKGSKSRKTLMIENELLRGSLKASHGQIVAQDQVIEGCHAQLVYQNLHLHRQNFALNAKENQRKTEKTQLFDGEGQVFTGDDFMAKIDAIAEAKQAAAAEKVARADTQKARKELSEALEREWTQIKEQHEADLLTWQADCNQLAGEGVQKRLWPKKPVRPLKPKPPTQSEGDVPPGQEEGEVEPAVGEGQEEDHYDN